VLDSTSTFMNESKIQASVHSSVFKKKRNDYLPHILLCDVNCRTSTWKSTRIRPRNHSEVASHFVSDCENTRVLKIKIRIVLT
jgi:hypothetical protein